jgi:hypothetical protein
MKVYKIGRHLRMQITSSLGLKDADIFKRVNREINAYNNLVDNLFQACPPAPPPNPATLQGYLRQCLHLIREIEGSIASAFGEPYKYETRLRAPTDRSRAEYEPLVRTPSYNTNFTISLDKISSKMRDIIKVPLSYSGILSENESDVKTVLRQQGYQGIDPIDGSVY